MNSPLFDAADIGRGNGKHLKDEIHEWAGDCVVTERGKFETGAALYACYCAWVPGAGIPPASERAFLRALGNIGVPRASRKGERVWLNIQLKPEWFEHRGAKFPPSVPAVERYRGLVTSWLSAKCTALPDCVEAFDDLYTDLSAHHGKKIPRNYASQIIRETAGTWTSRATLFQEGERVQVILVHGVQLRANPGRAHTPQLAKAIERAIEKANAPKEPPEPMPAEMPRQELVPARTVAIYDDSNDI